ncbi:MAG: HAMP domain-containing protein [Acidimicrobiia bacterium]|nr:HAMP domain-containing protein [Acidimicrobiia bacterium]
MQKILSDAVFADSRSVFMQVRDLQGAVVASTLGDASLSDASDDFVMQGRAEIVAGLIVSDSHNRLLHVAAGPVILDGNLLGVVVVAEDTAPLVDLVSDYTGLGETGETILGRRSSNGAVFLTPLRFDSDSALSRTADAISASPMLPAVAGQESLLSDGVDYRGEQVFAATRYVAAADWGVVVKIDAAEVYAPLDDYLLGAGLALLVVGVAAALGSWLVARPIAESVRNVSEASAAIAAGDWSRRVPAGRNDELGDLAINFNIMTRKLLDLTSSLEQKNQEVAERNSQLELLNKKLGQSNEELERFASVAAHDLQEPLRKILAFGDRLATNASDRLDDRDQMYIERMRDAAARMRVLIDDLLQVSRVTSRGQPYEPVDLAEVLSKVADDLENQINESGAILEVGDLPTVMADPSQMHRLFQNLISNAIKFRKPDQSPVIRVSETQNAVPSHQNGEATITVQDNGIGFDQEYGERIFRIFERLNARSDYEGTGIGLAVCRKIVSRHHGAISAQGTPGHGAIFTVSLPRNAATNSGEAT